MAYADPIEKMVGHAKIRLLLSQPFFGTMATGLIVILTSDKYHSWCSTAATDGKHLFINREFVKALTFDELLFVIAHEVMHGVLDHLGRRQGREKNYYNMAGDYLINDCLVKAKIGVMPPLCLLSPKYNEDWTTEKVYEDLVKNKAEIKFNFDQHCDGEGKASPKPSGGKGEQPKPSEVGKEQDGGQGDSGDGKEDGQGSGGGSSLSDLTVTITNNGSDGPPTYSAEQLAELSQDVLQRTIQAVEAFDSTKNGSGAGTVPGMVRRLIKEATEPKIDWRELIDTHIRSQIADNYTFARLSRGDYGEFIIPAEDDDTIAEADIWIDTSGSMGETLLREIMSEVKGIMTSFGEFKLRVGCFDAKAYEVYEFTDRNADEIDDFQLVGGGGTMFTCFWQAMADEERVPERLVVFTDGYPCDSWGNGFENYCDTVWVVHGGCRTEAPFGLTVFYEDAKKSDELLAA